MEIDACALCSQQTTRRIKVGCEYLHICQSCFPTTQIHTIQVQDLEPAPVVLKEAEIHNDSVCILVQDRLFLIPIPSKATKLDTYYELDFYDKEDSYRMLERLPIKDYVQQVLWYLNKDDDHPKKRSELELYRVPMPRRHFSADGRYRCFPWPCIVRLRWANDEPDDS